MFDNKEFSIGRSGTAPTHQRGKAPTYTRPRPKTRTGISNDGGASDLADLNLALKMDNQLNIVDDDEAFENYQSAIDSWETGLKSRHAPQSSSSSSARKNSGNSSKAAASSSHSSSSRNNSAAYKSSDPVSAAYFSQFRPSSRSTPSSSSTPTGSSPRSRLKAANRTDEIKAVYGVSSSNREAQSGPTSGHRRKPPRSSDAAASSRSAASRNKPTGTHYTSSNSRPPSAATSSTESRPPSGAGRKESHSSSSANHSSTLQAHLATVTAAFQEPSSYSHQYSHAHSPVTSQKKSNNDAPSAKGAPFKRQHQLRVATSPVADDSLADSRGGSDTVEPFPPRRRETAARATGQNRVSCIWARGARGRVQCWEGSRRSTGRAAAPAARCPGQLAPRPHRSAPWTAACC